jgi:hypothetical protein
MCPARAKAYEDVEEGSSVHPARSQRNRSVREERSVVQLKYSTATQDCSVQEDDGPSGIRQRAAEVKQTARISDLRGWRQHKDEICARLFSSSHNESENREKSNGASHESSDQSL